MGAVTGIWLGASNRLDPIPWKVWLAMNTLKRC